MNRFSLVLLSLFVCAGSVMYAADKKLGMAELCAKAADQQNPEQAQAAVRKIVSNGGSVCACYKDFIMPAKDAEQRKKLEEAGFYMGRINAEILPRETYEEPGFVCDASLTDSECAYLQKVLADMVPARRIVLKKDRNIFDNYYARLFYRDRRDANGRFVFDEHGIIIQEAIRGELIAICSDGLAASKDDEAALRGTIRHERTHLDEADLYTEGMLTTHFQMPHVMPKVRQDPSLVDKLDPAVAEFTRFHETRADVLPAACEDVHDMIAMVKSIKDHDHDNDAHEPDPFDTHPTKKQRLATVEHIASLLKAEEDFKQAYASCAAAQQS